MGLTQRTVGAARSQTPGLDGSFTLDVVLVDHTLANDTGNPGSGPVAVAVRQQQGAAAVLWVKLVLLPVDSRALAPDGAVGATPRVETTHLVVEAVANAVLEPLWR